jgi:hypothetical protein
MPADFEASISRLDRVLHSKFARLYDPVVNPAGRSMIVKQRRYPPDGIFETVLSPCTGTAASFPHFVEATAEWEDITLFVIGPSITFTDKYSNEYVTQTQ